MAKKPSLATTDRKTNSVTVADALNGILADSTYRPLAR